MIVTMAAVMTMTTVKMIIRINILGSLSDMLAVPIQSGDIRIVTVSLQEICKDSLFFAFRGKALLALHWNFIKRGYTARETVFSSAQ